MTRSFLSLVFAMILASAWATGASAASFSNYAWSWSDSYGNSGSGLLTANLLCTIDTCGSGTYDWRIDSMSGTFDDYAVTLDRQGTCCFFGGNDNLLFYPADPNALDDLGVAFTLGAGGRLAGDEINISYDQYVLSDSYGDFSNVPGIFSVSAVSSSVPEPPSVALLLAGLGLIGGAMHFGRKKLVETKA